MTLRQLAIAIFLSFSTASSFGQIQCSDALTPHFETIQTNWNGEPLSIQSPTDLQVGYRLAELVPPSEQERKLVIIFTHDHVYLAYAGNIISSFGQPGLYITSQLYPSKSIKGKIAFAVQLTDEQASSLKNIVANFKSKTTPSCARTTCSYVARVDESILDGKKYLLPHKMLDALMKKAANDPQRFQVWQLSPDSPEEVLAVQRAHAMSAIAGISPYLILGAGPILYLGKLLF